MNYPIFKYRVASEHDLWEPITISVQNDTIIESSVSKGVEIGASFTSMKSYWEQFEDENKYVITEIKESE